MGNPYSPRLLWHLVLPHGRKQNWSEDHRKLGHLLVFIATLISSKTKKEHYASLKINLKKLSSEKVGEPYIWTIRASQNLSLATGLYIAYEELFSFVPSSYLTKYLHSNC